MANKVRQNDKADSIAVRTIEDTAVLELTQEINGVSYVTWIYYMDGAVRELFTNAGSGLGLADGLEIIDSRGLTFRQEGNVLEVQVADQSDTRLLLNIRSGGVADEK